MFFLPLDRMPDWRNPPVITLLLLIINVLFFYIWQANDNKYIGKAYDYYQSSQLYIPELKAYDEYRHFKHKLTRDELKNGSPELQKRIKQMISDQRFQQKLDKDQVIEPGDIGYSDWRSKRNRFNALVDMSVSHKYGIIPSRDSPITYVTSMFLHGSNGHLWGNMVGLVALGYVVELVLGPALFLFGYLLTGLAANWLYVVLYPHSIVPGIGASGAIFGILGMYVIIFGFRKVNFFYFMFVYFDYVRAPALLMVPFYLAYQGFLHYFTSTNVNTTAHVGGLLCGALFVGVLKLIPGTIKISQVDSKKQEEDFQKEYQSALQLMSSMNFDDARSKFEELLKQRPNDITLKQQLYNASKYNPASEHYHQYALQLLKLPGSDRTSVNIIHDTFTDYAGRAKPKPRWTPELLSTMSVRFAACGFLDDAEKLVNFMLKARPDYPRNPEALAALTRNLNGKDKQKMQHYRDLLLQRYPHSDEARHLQTTTGMAVND